MDQWTLNKSLQWTERRNPAQSPTTVTGDCIFQVECYSFIHSSTNVDLASCLRWEVSSSPLFPQARLDLWWFCGGLCVPGKTRQMPHSTRPPHLRVKTGGVHSWFPSCWRGQELYCEAKESGLLVILTVNEEAMNGSGRIQDFLASSGWSWVKSSLWKFWWSWALGESELKSLRRDSVSFFFCIF